jgi:hypothetical protein
MEEVIGNDKPPTYYNAANITAVKSLKVQVSEGSFDSRIWRFSNCCLYYKVFYGSNFREVETKGLIQSTIFFEIYA